MAISLLGRVCVRFFVSTFYTVDIKENLQAYLLCLLPMNTHTQKQEYTLSRTHYLSLCMLDSRWQPIIGLTEQSSGRHPVTPPPPLLLCSPKTPNTAQQAQDTFRRESPQL